MANVTPDSGFPAGLYRIETTDYATGGEAGIANKQAKQIAGGLAYLKERTDYQGGKVGSSKDIRELSASTTLDAEDAGKFILVDTASAINLILDWELGDVSLGDGVLVAMRGSHSSDSGSVTISSSPTRNFVGVNGDVGTSVTLRNGESAEILFSGGDFKVLKQSSAHGQVPIGGIIRFKSSSGVTTLPGYEACLGDTVLRSSYPLLFAAIGTAYGVGDGSTTFVMPNIPDHFIRVR